MKEFNATFMTNLPYSRKLAESRILRDNKGCEILSLNESIETYFDEDDEEFVVYVYTARLRKEK